MPRRHRIDLEDYDFRPVPDDALETTPGATPASIIGRIAGVQDTDEASADVSGFDGGADFGGVPENAADKFSTVGSRSYQRADYAPPDGRRPVIAEFARYDSRYGVDPRGSDYGFPFAPQDFEPAGFEGVGELSTGTQRGGGNRGRGSLHAVGEDSTMAVQGTLEYAIRNLLRAKLSDALDAEGVTEVGVRVSPSEALTERWGGVAEAGLEFGRGPTGMLDTGIDAEGVDEDHTGTMGQLSRFFSRRLTSALQKQVLIPPRPGTALRVSKPSVIPLGPAAKMIQKLAPGKAVFRNLAMRKLAKHEGVVRKSEIMRAAEPEIVKMAGDMASTVRRETRSRIRAAEAGSYGPAARRGVVLARLRERRAETKAYDLPAADANDPRALSEADTFFVYPEQDWDGIRMPVSIEARPATPGQTRAIAVEGIRRALTEFEKHHSPVLTAEALDKMGVKPPPPGQAARTAGEAARVVIENSLAKRGISLPRKPKLVRKAAKKVSSLFSLLRGRRFALGR